MLLYLTKKRIVKQRNERLECLKEAII